MQNPRHKFFVATIMLIFIATTALAFSCGRKSKASDETTSTYAIGGTVLGLNGTLKIRLNVENETALTQDGAYAFSDELFSGETFSVTVTEMPLAQSCIVDGGTGFTATIES